MVSERLALATLFLSLKDVDIQIKSKVFEMLVHKPKVDVTVATNYFYV